MCGIAGILRTDSVPVDPGLVERMVRSIAHRGPDELAVYVDSPVGLGHARLSIIDLRTGQQPMCTEDGRLWITFNGEIFNYLQLREELIARGHRFATESDTEVILHAYQEYGADCTARLNGQWAFAIWNSRDRTLFLSRDRLGVRPLFYATTASGSVVFASEIKALFQVDDVRRELDVDALDQVFTFWTTVPPRTPFAGVWQLPPGHSLTIDGPRLDLKQYWQPRYEQDDELSVDQYAGRFLDLLIDAIRLRLRADVPVGAYLSGGLDSSATTAIIKRFTSAPVRTFSVTFEDAEFDESRHQRDVIAFLRTDHDTYRCTNADIARVFPDVVWHTETPILRTAPAPLFLLSRLVSTHGYKVVVTGEGADEVLGGYDIFKEAKMRRFWSRFPESTMRPRLLRRLYPYMPALQAQPAAYLQSFFRVTAADCASPFFSHLPRWSLTAKLKSFYSSDTRRRVAGDRLADLEATLPRAYPRWDDFSRAQYLETAHLLPGYILSSQGDRMAMAHAVEGRYPFLDHRIVEFAGSVPPRLKMRALNEKYLLKRVVRGLVPESTRRRKKQPYRAPDAKSFFTNGRAAADYVGDLLSPGRLQQDALFDPAAVQRLVAKVQSGNAIGVRDNMAFVGILSTQLLVHRFLRAFRHADDSQRTPQICHRQLPVRLGGQAAR